MDHLDHIYYINVDYRNDRRLEMLDWLEETNVPESKIVRIDAIHIPGRGHIGCIMSHIKAVETFLNSGDKLSVIFEDDYEPLDRKTFWSSVEKVFEDKIEFDALLLSYNVLKSEEGPKPYLKKVLESMTASGYILTRPFAEKLLARWKDGLQKALQEEERTKIRTSQYMNDVYWFEVLATHTTYCIYPRIGYQRASFSDLQMQYTDYKA